MHTTSTIPLSRNQPSLPWLVQKYGGTSVGKCLDTITSVIVPSSLKSHRVVVVCSAQSGHSKETGTTNRLLKAAAEAIIEGSTIHIELVKDILADHLQAAKAHIQNPDLLQQVCQQIENDCLRLKSFLQAAEIIEEISPRSKDVIIGMGEMLSCKLVAAVLKDKGIDSEFVNLNNMIDQEFSVLDQSFYDYLAQRLATIVQQCGDKVPVLTGFFGHVPGSLLSTIGRGYTDLCAALTAVGLDAEELQVWKEVDGIFTADPRKVATARLLPKITPDEAAELTYYGSEVIHPFTMDQVIRAHIPIRIKNVKNPQGHGTIIFPQPPDQSPAANGAANGTARNATTPLPKHPTAVTIKDGIAILNVHSNRKNVSHGFLAKIFTTLDEHGIVVDLISTSEVHVSMALGTDLGTNALEKAVRQLSVLGSVDVMESMAILSLVGQQMKSMVGVAGHMFTTLAKAGISIEIISQGASEINISCVVAEADAIKAMQVVHAELLDKNLDAL
ncbi:aspartate kinase [Hesseltinella vesiculosa]|uniref:Aspartokinase n=1 Tax=Hesseltinella vesiculosa TaxID=101127 RepID=A0A1X2GVP7_9FUNG|nr:aspartate kinase [Hesseltinella vesiculosa]